MYKKEDITSILIIILLLSIIIFSPQITNFFEEMSAITGLAIEQQYTLNITVGNQAPTIPSINVSVFSPATPTVILNDKRSVSFTFVACDPDGNSDIDQGFANLTGSNDTNNYFDANLTCEATAWTNTTCNQFNCSFDMWYFYKSGEWNVSINVTDGTDWAYNNGSNFNYASTTGIVIGPSSITWTGLSLDSRNQTSGDDPITINNTGNYNISLSKVNVTAYNLRGEETQTEEIPAANMTVDIETTGDPPLECDENFMVNATSTDITNSMLPRGNHTANDGSTGQEQLYFCINHVPPITMISAQSYSTQNSLQWKIGVS